MRDQVRLTKEQRDRFCAEYLLGRDQGMNRRNAYLWAKKNLAADGIPAPAFNTLDAWIRYGLPKDGVQDTGPSPAAAELEQEATGIAACGNEEEFTQITDREMLYRALLRLYRFRREEDIDALVDLAAPELLGEEEA